MKTTTKLDGERAKDQPAGSDASSGAERIYLATPKSLYGTMRLRRAADQLRTQFPRAVILLPSELFRGREDWIARFPAVLVTITRLVFLTDDDGFIGRGVASECHAVLQRGKPVELITESGRLIPSERLRLSPANEDDWAQYRQVSLRPKAD